MTENNKYDSDNDDSYKQIRCSKKKCKVLSHKSTRNHSDDSYRASVVKESNQGSPPMGDIDRKGSSEAIKAAHTEEILLYPQHHPV